jgi:hypothetical protein
MTAEQIIQRMAAQYASAKTYQDVGIIQDIKSGGQIEAVNSFKTYFVRPNKFRFEWESYSFRGDREWNIVWGSGANVFKDYWWGEVEKEENLSMAIAGATGVSRGAAHTIPTLLMKEVGGFRFTDLARISLLHEEKFENVACFVVRGYHPFGFPIDLWISKTDFLLRKSREKREDGRFEEEIRRNVKVNGPIPVSTFQYSPSKKTPKIKKTPKTDVLVGRFDRR